MFFRKKKQTISSEELAQTLAVSFSTAIEEELSDRSKLKWMWEALPQAEADTVRQEWVVVQMFLRSLAFRNHSQDLKAVETLLDCFHSFALQSLTQNGLVQSDGNTEGFLQQRYRDYYQAMQGSKDFQFQIMKVAETFFHHCGGISVEAVLVATTYFMHALVAEKNLITRLEKDSVIVS